MDETRNETFGPLKYFCQKKKYFHFIGKWSFVVHPECNQKSSFFAIAQLKNQEKTPKRPIEYYRPDSAAASKVMKYFR